MMNKTPEVLNNSTARSYNSASYLEQVKAYLSRAYHQQGENISQEITQDPAKYYSLLEEVYKTLSNQDSELDLSVLQSLAIVIHSLPESLYKRTSETLVKVLKALIKYLDSKYKSLESDTAQSQLLLQAISQILDEVAKAAITGIVYAQVQKPLDKLLSKLSDNPELCFQTYYAREALAHIPREESRWQELWNQESNTILGAATPASAIRNADLNKILETFDHFSEAFSGADEIANKLVDLAGEMKKFGTSGSNKIRQQRWYAALKFLDICLEEGQFEQFVQFARHSSYTHNEAFLLGLCQRLEQIARIQKNFQETAIECLEDLILNKHVQWGQYERVQNTVYDALGRLEQILPDPLRAQAHTLRESLPSAVRHSHSTNEIDGYVIPIWDPDWQQVSTQLLDKSWDLLHIVMQHKEVVQKLLSPNLSAIDQPSSMTLPEWVRAATPAQKVPVDVSIHGKNALVDYLFEKALSMLTSLSIPNKPSLFLIYAHDDPACGEAKADIAKYLIEKLSTIRFQLYSEQTPRGPMRSSSVKELRDGKLEDILTNQLYLLPAKLREGVEPVDKVVVCCSQVLGNYLTWSNYQDFYQALRIAYRQDLEQRSTAAIREVVRRFSQEEPYQSGFHHVLTEIAFLQIREEQLKDQHGVISVPLTAKSHASCLAHFVPETTVRIGDIPRFEAQAQAGREVYPSQVQHLVLFKLIERLLAGSDEARTFLGKFWQGYGNLIARLKEDPLPSAREFEKFVEDIFKDIRTALHSQLASTMRESQVAQKQALQATLQPLAILGDNVERFKQAYQESLKETGESDVLSMYAPLQGIKKGPQGEEIVDLDAELEQFFASEASVFLLLGTAGSGKSTFNRHLALKKLTDYQRLSQTSNDSPLVFFVEFRSIENPNKQVIQQFLQSKGFGLEQIEALRTHPHQRCIFIFDGYDEIEERNRNFYELNELWRWEKAKFVITSRPEYLDANYQTYFRPKSSPQALWEAWMAPFSPEQRSLYIQHYVEKNNPRWSIEQYEQAFNQLTPLGKELERPVALCMLLQILPELKATDQTAKSLTLGAVYEQYFRHWWENWQVRLGQIQLTPAEEKAKQELEREGGFIGQGFAYIQNCALALTKAGLTTAEDSDSFEKLHRSVYEAFFEESAKARLQRFNAPFRVTEKKHYAFSHKSMQEYLVARAICAPDFEALEPHHTDELNQLLLVNEPVILDFLVEQVKAQPMFKTYLHAWIEASKQADALVTVGASNAITILVRAGVQFNGADLKGVHVPGADLSYGIFDSAQLQGADLTKVNLRNSWLRQANLSMAKMEGVQFGEWPYLEEESKVNSCAYSPDGKTCAVGLGNGKINVYATSNWEKIFTLVGHTAWVESVVYSPNGHQLASASWDKTVRLWDSHSGQLSHTLAAHTEAVYGVAYSPSGHQLASASEDRTVRLWDSHSGQLSHTLAAHTEAVYGVAYSPSGHQLASASEDRTVRLWDAHSGQLSHTLEGHIKGVTSVVYSPSGHQLASASWDKTVRLWDARSDQLIHTLEGHTDRVLSVVYSPSGHQLASASEDRTVRLWDAHSGQLSHTLEGHAKGVISVVYSLSGHQLASASWDKTVRVWDGQMPEVTPLILRGHQSAVTSVVMSADGRYVVSGSQDGVRVWDWQKPEAASRVLRGHESSVNSVVMSADGRYVVSGSQDGVRVWDWQKPEAASPVLRGHESSVNSAVMSADGRYVVSGSQDGTVRVWDWQKPEAAPRVLRGHESSVNSVVMSADGRYVVSGSQDKTVRVWDWQMPEAVPRVLRGHESWVSSVVISADGRYVVSGSKDGKVRMWDWQTPEAAPRALRGHESWVSSVVISADGRYMVSGGSDNTVRLWDTQRGQCLAVMRDFLGTVNSMVWQETTDGTYLVTGCEDKSVRVWQIIEDEGRAQVHLHWSSTHDRLTVTDTIIQHVQGLSGVNEKLLKQHGAVLGECTSSSSRAIADVLPEPPHYNQGKNDSLERPKNLLVHVEKLARYVPREEQSDQLLRLLKEEHSTLIEVIGPSGAGKTTLIQHLIRSNPDPFFASYALIAWIDCSSASRANADIQAISYTLGYGNPSPGKALQHVVSYLHQHPRSLLILDGLRPSNVDFVLAWLNLSFWAGQLIYTTTQTLTEKLSQNLRQSVESIHLSLFTPDQAKHLVQQYLPEESLEACDFAQVIRITGGYPEIIQALCRHYEASIVEFRNFANFLAQSEKHQKVRDTLLSKIAQASLGPLETQALSAPIAARAWNLVKQAAWLGDNRILFAFFVNAHQQVDQEAIQTLYDKQLAILEIDLSTQSLKLNPAFLSVVQKRYESEQHSLLEKNIKRLSEVFSYLTDNESVGKPHSQPSDLEPYEGLVHTLLFETCAKRPFAENVPLLSQVLALGSSLARLYYLYYGQLQLAYDCLQKAQHFFKQGLSLELIAHFEQAPGDFTARPISEEEATLLKLYAQEYLYQGATFASQLVSRGQVAVEVMQDFEKSYAIQVNLGQACDPEAIAYTLRNYTRALRKQGLLVNALEEYEKLKQWMDQHPAVFDEHMRAKLLVDQGIIEKEAEDGRPQEQRNYQKAIDTLSKTHDIYLKHKTANQPQALGMLSIYLGETYLAAGDFEKGITHTCQILHYEDERRERQARAYFNLARAFDNKEGYEALAKLFIDQAAPLQLKAYQSTTEALQLNIEQKLLQRHQKTTSLPLDTQTAKWKTQTELTEHCKAELVAGSAPSNILSRAQIHALENKAYNWLWRHHSKADLEAQQAEIKDKLAKLEVQEKAQAKKRKLQRQQDELWYRAFAQRIDLDTPNNRHARFFTHQFKAELLSLIIERLRRVYGESVPMGKTVLVTELAQALSGLLPELSATTSVTATLDLAAVMQGLAKTVSEARLSHQRAGDQRVAEAVAEPEQKPKSLQVVESIEKQIEEMVDYAGRCWQPVFAKQDWHNRKDIETLAEHGARRVMDYLKAGRADTLSAQERVVLALIAGKANARLTQPKATESGRSLKGSWNVQGFFAKPGIKVEKEGKEPEVYLPSWQARPEVYGYRFGSPVEASTRRLYKGPYKSEEEAQAALAQQGPCTTM